MKEVHLGSALPWLEGTSEAQAMELAVNNLSALLRWVQGRGLLRWRDHRRCGGCGNGNRI